MTRLPIPNGEYGAALISGHYAVQLIGQHKVQTHAGPVATGPEDVLYCRCTDTGGFRFAGQSSVGRGDVLYHLDGSSTVIGDGYGENTVVFLPDGTPRVATKADGSQGLRYVDESGKVVTADNSHLSPDHLIADYTQLHGVTIGQNQNGSGAVVQLDGVLRLLEPGDCEFIRVDTDGTNFAIAITKLPERQCVLFWLTRAELATLQQLPIGPQNPPPPPTGEPTVPFDPRADQSTRAWSDDQLLTAINVYLQQANSSDDPKYWFDVIRAHPAPVGQADWFYWRDRILTGDGVGKGSGGHNPPPLDPGPAFDPKPLQDAIAALSARVAALESVPTPTPVDLSPYAKKGDPVTVSVSGKLSFFGENHWGGKGTIDK